MNRFSQQALTAAAAAWLIGCATTAAPPPPPAPEPAPPPAAAPMPAPVMATAPVAMRDDAPLIYTVRKGDTLWGIANRFLLDPWQWPEVWYVNDKIRNPHLIYPGDVLKLVNVDGRNMITREGGGLERVSPQVRELPLEDAIPTIPIEAIREFLRGPRLVSQDELNASPYLLAFVEEHIVGGSGNGIYVQNLKPSKAYQYTVIRKGDVYRDPDDNAILGYEGLPVGEAEVQKYGKPSTAVLATTSREALVGDRLLPVEAEAFSTNFYPHAPPNPLKGHIISVYDGVSQIGQYMIITINRGSNHGLEPGHVIDILQSSRGADDPYGYGSIALPDEYAGKALVFKVTPRASFALVMSAIRSIHVQDKIEKPEPSRRAG